MRKVIKGRGYDYLINYYIVWCVTHREKILVGEIAETTKEILNDLALEHGFAIAEMKIEPDYVRLLLECKPQHYIPNMIKALKGVGGRRLFIKYPCLKEKVWRGYLWRSSYFVATENENIEKQIEVYIESQSKK